MISAQKQSKHRRCEAASGNVVAKRGKAILGMFEKPVLGVEDGPSFDVVRSAVQAALAPSSAAKFLKRVDGQRMRVRDFEAVLAKGLLGQEAIAAYGRLGDLDRGQVRELYLESVEHVAPELRAKYLKVYAYY
jgi:hypothetical protein